jgi:hypothetical protein
LLDVEFKRLSNQGIELLKHGGGEIEDYMPSRLTDIGEIVELVSNNNWIVDINDEATRIYLGKLVGRILDIREEHLHKFLEDIKLQKKYLRQCSTYLCIIDLPFPRCSEHSILGRIEGRMSERRFQAASS